MAEVHRALPHRSPHAGPVRRSGGRKRPAPTELPAAIGLSQLLQPRVSDRGHQKRQAVEQSTPQHAPNLNPGISFGQPASLLRQDRCWTRRTVEADPASGASSYDGRSFLPNDFRLTIRSHTLGLMFAPVLPDRETSGFPATLAWFDPRVCPALDFRQQKSGAVLATSVLEAPNLSASLRSSPEASVG